MWSIPSITDGHLLAPLINERDRSVSVESCARQRGSKEQRRMQILEHALYLASCLMFAAGSICFVSAGFVEMWIGTQSQCESAPCSYDYLSMAGAACFIFASVLDALGSGVHADHVVESVEIASCVCFLVGSSIQLVGFVMTSTQKTRYGWELGGMVIEMCGLAIIATAILLDVISKQMHLYFTNPNKSLDTGLGCVSETGCPAASPDGEKDSALPFHVIKDQRTRTWVSMAGGNIFFLGVALELMGTAIGIYAAVRTPSSHVWLVSRHTYLAGLIAGESLVTVGTLVEAVCYV